MRSPPHYPRIRKTIKWGKYGGAALTVLLCLAWAASTSWTARWTPHTDLTIWWENGGITIFAAEPGVFPPEPTSFSVERTSGSIMWRPQFSNAGPAVFVWLPLWIPIGLLSLLVIFAWRLEVRASRPAGCCPTCHYDRTGLPGGHDAVCPECGTRT